MLVSSDAAPEVAPVGTLDFSPLPRVGAAEGTSAEVADVAAPEQAISEVDFTFEKPGPLGIEFVEHEPPYVVEQVHSGGVAFGVGILRTDRLLEVAGQSVVSADWETLKTLLTQRPVTVKFLRDPAAVAAAQNGGGAALLSGFAGRMRSFGGSVAQQGLGLGTAVGSMAGNVAQQGLGNVTNKVAQQGLGLGGLSSAVGSMAGNVAQQGLGGLGTTVGSLGSDLGSKMGNAAQSGLGLGGKVGSTMGGMGSSLYSGLLDTLKEINDDGPSAKIGGLDDDANASILPSAGAPAALEQAPLPEERPAPPEERKSPDVAPTAGPPEVGALPRPLSPRKADAAATLPLQVPPEVCKPKQEDGGAASPSAVQHFNLAESDHESERVGAPSANLADVHRLRRQHEGELSQRDGKIQALEEALRELESKRAAERSSGEEVKATLEAKESQLRKLEQDLSALRAESGNHSAAVAARDSQVAELQSKLEAAERSAQEATAQLQASSSEKAALQSESQEGTATLRQEVEDLQVKLRRAEQQLTDGTASRTQEQETNARLQEQLQAAQAELANVANLKGHVAQLQDSLASKEAELQQCAAQKSQEEQLANLQGYVAHLQGQVAQLTESLASKEAELQHCAALKSQVEQLSALPGHINQLQASLVAKDAELQQCTALRSQVEKMQAEQLQLTWAAKEKDKQLLEKVEALGRKDEEIKSLIRQLAAVGEMSPQVASVTQEAETSTTFDVMFALEGPLGIEFTQQNAPYIVAKVHPDKVASGLGIQPNDELIAIADHDVTEEPWGKIVPLVSQRPVVAKFRRPPPPSTSNGNEAGQDRGMLSSVSNLGTSLLTKAITKGGSTPANAAAVAEATGRLQAEVERLGTLLRARDEELEECGNRLKQRDEALRVLQAGDAAAVETATMVQDKEALTQRVDQLHTRCEQMEQMLKDACSQRDEMNARCAEEARQKEEFRQQTVALTERSNSLMKQFEDLRNTCQNLTVDAQHKGALEGQVAELARMNAQWQQAHQNLNADAENLRQQTADMQTLQSEVVQLRNYAQAYDNVLRRLQETEAQLESSQQQMLQVQQERMGDQGTIQRLQAAMDSMHEDGESQAGLLEAELLERTREAASLRREAEEQRRRIQELMTKQAEMREAAEAGQALRVENTELRSELEKEQQEKESLNGVIERCVEKFEKESRERPHLVDKRMVTQMMAAYLEQRDNPREQQEIAARMADLLGFTSAEREQCGLRDGRKRLKAPGEDGVEDLTNAFVDFLLEESES